MIIIELLKRIFSRANNELQFERDLVSLSSKIRAATQYKASLKCNQKRYNLLLVLYFSLALLCSLGYLVFVRPEAKGFLVLAIATALGIFLWKAFEFYYSKRIAIYDAWLVDLKREQKSKVEEFKLKSGYYKAKSLIERFDDEEAEDEGERFSANGLEKGFDAVNSLEKLNANRTNTFHRMNYNKTNASNPTFLNQANNSNPINLQQAFPTVEMPSNAQIMQQNESFLNSDNSLCMSPKGLNTFQTANASSSPETLSFTRSLFGQKLLTRGWMDKIVDAVLGETPAHYKYALICNSCYTHN
jgi:hypothetical protein